MSLLRFASLLVLAAWTGGLVVLGAVGAPTIFEVLEARDPVGGRVVAGEVFGAIFQQFQHLAWIFGALLLILLVLRAILGPRPRPFAARVAIVTMMLGSSLVSALLIAPRIDAIRTSTSGAVAALPDADPNGQEFGRLHGWSSGLMGLTLLGGIWLIWAEMKDSH
jgi:tellurite resistance protein TehA-like permease